MSSDQDFSPDEWGLWAAYGEDRSMGGMWDQPNVPFLGYYEGEYDHVLTHCKKMKRWKSYGKGGHLIKIEITKID